VIQMLNPMEPEPVHTMTGWYDGPRSGIADYQGRPHLYESLWAETPENGWTDLFMLMPIDDDTFTLAMESWSIWLRWEAAFHAGEATQDTHPALPPDRTRQEHLDALLADRLKIDPRTAIVARGNFTVLRSSNTTTSASWQAQWTPTNESVEGMVLFSKVSD
jgi:hypothetical protein